jgi:hypothetical protein
MSRRHNYCNQAAERHREALEGVARISIVAADVVPEPIWFCACFTGIGLGTGGLLRMAGKIELL